jgi:alcohol dehydrogenase
MPAQLSTVVVVLVVSITVLISYIPPVFQLHDAPADPTAEPMFAITYAQHGNSSNLVYGRITRPGITDNQILVKNKYASINPCDFKFRRMTKLPAIVADFLFPLPHIPSLDVSGEVVAVGSAVANFKVGDRVAAMLPILHTRWGALAEFSPVDAKYASIIPPSLTFKEAAAVPLVSLTMLQGLAEVADLTPGKSILVQAGAGGVGSIAIQWASKVRGLVVSATSSPKKFKILKDLGATNAIDYRSTTDNFDDHEPRYDVVLDMMSYAYEKRTIGGDSVLAKPNGHYLNIASSDWALAESGDEATIGLTSVINLLKSALGLGPRYSLIAVNPDGAGLANVFSEMSKGTVKAVIDREFDLKDAARAFDFLETGSATGKVVIKIA